MTETLRKRKKHKQPRKKTTSRVVTILLRKEKRQARHQWYIERKEGKHKGPCPI